jgi:predicted TIM-barrel fold metal-dependent hydrolase
MKVLYASDYPLLTFERVRRELPSCGISDDVMPWFVRHNAERVFWGERDAVASET